MDLAAWSALEWLALIEVELLLFAGVFFLLRRMNSASLPARVHGAGRRRVRGGSMSVHAPL